ncbi:MAG: DUF4079 domain-containing protein [Cyanobacteria bacterium J06642_11]
MGINDWLRLMHPILAVSVVFPLIGVVSYFALQTRQRRLAVQAKEKSKIPPVVGKEHVNLGKWLTGAVVGLTLVGVGHPIFKNIVKRAATDSPVSQGTVIFIVFMFLFTIGSLVCLYRATAPQKLWRGIFAALTTAGLWILGSQDGVFRRTYEWQVSHYYYGMVAATLMVISLAILPEIYKSKTWRKVHIALNCIALLLFVVQGITGTRDLLEIPLSWQEPFVFGCDFANKTCGG